MEYFYKINSEIFLEAISHALKLLANWKTTKTDQIRYANTKQAAGLMHGVCNQFEARNKDLHKRVFDFLFLFTCYSLL